MLSLSEDTKGRLSERPDVKEWGLRFFFSTLNKTSHLNIIPTVLRYTDFCIMSITVVPSTVFDVYPDLLLQGERYPESEMVRLREMVNATIVHLVSGVRTSTTLHEIKVRIISDIIGQFPVLEQTPDGKIEGLANFIKNTVEERDRPFIQTYDADPCGTMMAYVRAYVRKTFRERVLGDTEGPSTKKQRTILQASGKRTRRAIRNKLKKRL